MHLWIGISLQSDIGSLHLSQSDMVSWQALGLNVPENMITATIGASLWKYTSEKIEFRHDINYKNGNTASGGGSFSLGPIGPHVNNTITFQMDFYF